MKKEAMKLKDYLIKIAENMDENTTLEDVYEQLSLLSDIEISEQQEKNGETMSQEDVEKASKKWLK